MKAALFAVAAVAFAFPALAGEMQGTVKEVNKEMKSITLTDGMSAMANDAMVLDGVMAGDKVMIMTDDKNMVTEVKKM